MRAPGFELKEKIRKMTSDVDDHGAGIIGHEGFLKMKKHKILNRGSVEFRKMQKHEILNRSPEDEIWKTFRTLDDAETGKTSFKNLPPNAKKLAAELACARS